MRASKNRKCVLLAAIRRSGVSLIELLACISILITVMVLAGTTFQLLFRADKSVSQSFVTERSISRLAMQFRDDVHRSKSGVMNVDLANAKNELSLNDGSSVDLRYTVTKEGLARLVVDGDTITAREDYRLPDCQVRFTADPEAVSQWLTLTIDRPGIVLVKNGPVAKPNRPLAIQAYLNRFHSLNDSGNRIRPKVELEANPKTAEESK